MKHNIYFEGKVQSLGLTTSEGTATVGVISPGKFTFSTSSEEQMVIISGTLEVKLPRKEWVTMKKTPSSSFQQNHPSMWKQSLMSLTFVITSNR